VRSAKRQQTTDNGLHTPGRKSLDQGQRSVVGSQWSRIRKDAMPLALCALAFFLCENRRKSAVKTLCGLGVLVRKTFF